MKSTTQDCKLFIGGLSRSTTIKSLHDYFSKYGTVEECFIPKNSWSGKSRCFGYIVMESSLIAQKILDLKNHKLDDTLVDCKWALPENSLELDPAPKLSKIFIGGIPRELSDEAFEGFLTEFGEVEDSIVMRTGVGNSRGFGFVTFTHDSSVELILSNYASNEINGKWVDVKLAIPADYTQANKQIATTKIKARIDPTPPKKRLAAQDGMQEEAKVKAFSSVKKPVTQRKNDAATDETEPVAEEEDYYLDYHPGLYDEAKIEIMLLRNILIMINQLLGDD